MAQQRHNGLAWFKASVAAAAIGLGADAIAGCAYVDIQVDLFSPPVGFLPDLGKRRQ